MLSWAHPAVCLCKAHLYSGITISLVEKSTMSTIPVHNDVTVLLKQWQLGDKQVEQQLTQLIYEKLHQLAASCMRGERKNHTLQATALVNEAYIGLLQAEVNYQDRRHFFCLAARLMRRILVDHARARLSSKRGDGAIQVTFENLDVCIQEDNALITLDKALTVLTEQDPQKAELLDLRYFAGLNATQIADLYNVSVKTIERSTKLAKAWLHQAL